MLARNSKANFTGTSLNNWFRQLLYIGHYIRIPCALYHVRVDFGCVFVFLSAEAFRVALPVDYSMTTALEWVAAKLPAPCTIDPTDRSVPTYGWWFFNCSRELDSDAREIRGELYCLRCHDKMGIPICGACRRPVEDRVVTALGKHWHVEVSLVAKEASFWCFWLLWWATNSWCSTSSAPNARNHFSGRNITSEKVWLIASYITISCLEILILSVVKSLKTVCDTSFLTVLASEGHIFSVCVSALNKTWKPENFVCWACETPLDERWVGLAAIEMFGDVRE